MRATPIAVAGQLTAMVVRLACSNSLLLVYLEGLLQVLSSTAPAEGSEAVVEMLRVADILIRGASEQAQALGQAIASLVQARCQVWLAQSKLTPQDCSAVLAAPVVPGEVFGPLSEAALEQSRKTRELMRSVQRTPAVSKPRLSGRYVWGHGGGALGSVPLRPGALRAFFVAGGILARPKPGRLKAGAVADGYVLHASTPVSLAAMYPVPLGAQHPGVWVQAPILCQAPRFRGIVPTVLRDGAERQSLSAEIAALLEKGAVTLLPSEEMGQGFYLAFFLIPKRDGGLRPILNLKGFNRFLKRLPFRMLSLSRLLLSVRHGDWFTTVDLRDAHFHIPIHWTIG